MKLIKISGKLWELTVMQDGCFGEVDAKTETEVDERNKRLLDGCWSISARGSERPLANHGTRSHATAVIEIISGGLPQQQSYAIYHNSKGFFCLVQGKRIFLKDLLDGFL